MSDVDKIIAGKPKLLELLLWLSHYWRRELEDLRLTAVKEAHHE